VPHGVPTLEVGYTLATTGREDHEVNKGHVVALEREREKKNLKYHFLMLVAHMLNQSVIHVLACTHICVGVCLCLCIQAHAGKTFTLLI
jgi:hypothetical protein